MKFSKEDLRRAEKHLDALWETLEFDMPYNHIDEVSYAAAIEVIEVLGFNVHRDEYGHHTITKSKFTLEDELCNLYCR